MARRKPTDKRALVEAIKAHLSKELEVIDASARSAHEAAIHEDAKPENEYDTRGLESSYLASAQLERAAEVRAAIAALEFLELRAFGPTDAIEATALVDLEGEDAKQRCFVIPNGGGVKIALGKEQITLISPQSPLGRALLGRTKGEIIEVPIKGAIREYEIAAVE